MGCVFCEVEADWLVGFGELGVEKKDSEGFGGVGGSRMVYLWKRGG